VEEAVSGASATSLIARIEQELRDVWAAPDPSGVPLSRVCTMNLVVVSSSLELRDRYTPVVDEVTASIPARAIVASVEADAEGDELDGSATAVCSLDGARKVCSERVLLTAKGNASVRIASAVEALLVPEIPTALVWLGRVHVDDPLFEALADSADRVLLDSEYTSVASLLHVARWARTRGGRLVVGDLAWTRLAPWQELLARFFDGKDTQGLAEHVTRVRIHQASEHGARLGPEPALLLGWMATRLGWKTHRLGGSLRFRRPDGGLVAIELGAVARPEGVAPLALAEVVVEATAEAGGTLRGAITRDLGSGASIPPPARGGAAATPDADVMRWRLESPSGHIAEQKVRLGANKAAKWLERTLHRQARDAAFDESVAFAEQIVDDGLTVA
jgi:glucose-6-phosphate dehydrogenase assembly protein OpcA